MRRRPPPSAPWPAWLRCAVLAAPLLLFSAACASNSLLGGVDGPLGRGKLPPKFDQAAGGQPTSLDAKRIDAGDCLVRDQPPDQRCGYVRSHRKECGVDDGLLPYTELCYCWLCEKCAWGGVGGAP